MQNTLIKIFLPLTLFFSFSIGPVEADSGIAENFSCVDSSSVMDCVQQANETKAIQLEETPIDTQQLGYEGPVNFGLRYDTELKWIPELSYVQLFYDNGLGLQTDIGANEQRVNITLAHIWNSHQQTKITYEYLNQKLPYDFASGTVKESINQNAIGAAYRYLFSSRLIRSVDVSGYYIQANSKELSNNIYYQNNETDLNFRRIAGGKEGTGTANISLSPLRQTLITLGGGYSQLNYDMKYEDHSQNSTFAYNAGIEHLFTPRIKLSSYLTHSAAETDERIRIGTILTNKIESSLLGEFSKGLNGQPDSTSIMLSLAYPVANYALFPDDGLSSLKNWVQQPVIRATRVLAIKDEMTKKVVIGSSSNPSPQYLKTGNYIQEIRTRDYFNIDESLFDKVVYTLSLKPNGNNPPPPPQTLLNVDVKSDNNSIYQSIVYSTAPIPNGAAPNNDRNVYEIIITANGYRNNQILSSTNVSLDLNINFDPNNEPQWDKNKLAQKINFDTASINDPNAIPLNSILVSNQSNVPPQFTFSGGKTISGNWQIVTSANNSFLVRNPAAENTFDAADITTGSNTQPVNIYVKYNDDPDSYAGNPETLNITVNPDTNLKLSWNKSNANCQGKNIEAQQPQISTNIGATLPLDPCIVYSNIKVLNDSLTFKSAISSNFQGSLTLAQNPNQLQIGYPPAGMGNSYPVDLAFYSKAQGGSFLTTVTADGLISVTKTLIVTAYTSGSNKNAYQFFDGTYFTSIIINNLDNSKFYQFSSVDPKQAYAPWVCTIGIATDKNSFDNNCNPKVYSSPFKPINGQASLLWDSGSGSPTINTVTIIQN